MVMGERTEGIDLQKTLSLFETLGKSQKLARKKNYKKIVEYLQMDNKKQNFK